MVEIRFVPLTDLEICLGVSRAPVYQVGVISVLVHLYPAQRGHQETVVYVYRVYHIAARSLSMLSKADRFFLILLY